MASYSRNFLLSRCFWWKRSSTCFQNSRHCVFNHHQTSRQFPLDSSTWITLKSLGILRPFRGKRARRFSSKNQQPQQIKTIISNRSRREINIQVSSPRSSSVVTANINTNQHRGVNKANLSYPPRLPLTTQHKQSATLALLNARSVCNKTTIMNEFVIEKKVDILCITETWMKSNDLQIKNELSPKGYIFQHIPRKGRGGGVGFLYKKSLKLEKISLDKFKSFEVMGMLLKSSPNISFFVIYRPPPSSRNKLSTGMFFEEFSAFLEHLTTISGSLLLVGDFNFHVEDTSNSAAVKFLDLLKTFNFIQLVNQPTYHDRHILDLVITRNHDCVTTNISVIDPAISDHCAIFCDLVIKKPPLPKIVSTSRNLKAIDMEKFCNDIASSSLLTSPSDVLDGLITQYNSVLSEILDEHAPSKQRTVIMRPSSPWFSSKIKEELAKRRKLERSWRESHLTIHRELYVQQSLVVKNLIEKSKSEYFENILFSTFEKMVNTKTQKLLPSAPSPKYLANAFAQYFIDKINVIHSNFDETSNIEDTLVEVADSNLTKFEQVSVEIMSELISPLLSKSCTLDPIPGKLLKMCGSQLFSTVTKIVNLSLSTAYIPPSLKLATVRPQLKKSNLSCEDLSNYRPISNLTFLSKAIEKVVAFQLNNHLNKNNLNVTLQSAYKKHCLLLITINQFFLFF